MHVYLLALIACNAGMESGRLDVYVSETCRWIRTVPWSCTSELLASLTSATSILGSLSFNLPDHEQAGVQEPFDAVSETRLFASGESC